MWLRRFIRAVGVGVAVFAKRRPVVALLVALYGGFIVWGFIDRLIPPQQTQAREMADGQTASEPNAANERAEAERTARRERNRLLCKVKSICEQYGQVRQECATAGNFKNCIRVKMGDEKFAETGSCTDDGHMDAPSEPGAVDCFFSRIP